MKSAVTALIAVVVVVLLLECAWMIGLLGFHYPLVIQDEPLLHPQKVIGVQGTNLILESGAVLAIDTLEASDISNKLRQSRFEIDVDRTHGAAVAIWARQDGWVCGAPWAQPIRIPLIGDKTYRNRRQIIAVGAYLDPEGQQDGAANSHRR